MTFEYNSDVVGLLFIFLCLTWRGSNGGMILGALRFRNAAGHPDVTWYLAMCHLSV